MATRFDEVRSTKLVAYNSVTDLAGLRVCSYPSTFASLLGGVVFQERVMQPNLAVCIPLLRAGSVDAISDGHPAHEPLAPAHRQRVYNLGLDIDPRGGSRLP